MITDYDRIGEYRPRLCSILHVCSMSQNRIPFAIRGTVPRPLGIRDVSILYSTDLGRSANGCGTVPFLVYDERIFEPMTDRPDPPDSIPDSVCIVIPTTYIRRLLAELQSDCPAVECTTLTALVFEVALAAALPADRAAVLRWIDELGRGRWQ